jgi:hypothetical protein
MRPETINSIYRGMRCFYCGKPVHIPQNIIDRSLAIRIQESSSTQHLMSRVFLLRCRSCVREAVYTIDQVFDSPEAPAAKELGLI